MPDVNYDKFPGEPQVYTVNIKDGKSSLYTSIPMMNISANSNGIVLYPFCGR